MQAKEDTRDKAAGPKPMPPEPPKAYDNVEKIQRALPPFDPRPAEERSANPLDYKADKLARARAADQAIRAVCAWYGCDIQASIKSADSVCDPPSKILIDFHTVIVARDRANP